MANENVKKPDQQTARPEPIAVKSLHFNRPNGVTLPGLNSPVNSIDAAPKNDRDGWEIWLLPWMRQYRVTTVPNDKKKARRSFLVPESWAIAELAD